METDSHSFQFKNKASFPRHSLALIFDIEGFSGFFSQPDVELYVPRFLNQVFRIVSLTFNGGRVPWVDLSGNCSEKEGSRPERPVEWPALPGPVYAKYLGDGALYLWELGKHAQALNPAQVKDLFFRVSIIREAFPTLMKELSDEIPVADVPLNIRFGMAAGFVHSLSYAYNARSEYMGYAINLASRLQKYCPELGFISSARIEISQEQLNKIDFQKVIARRLKGFPREVVIVRKSMFASLDEETKQALFIEPAKEASPTVTEFRMESGQNRSQA